MKKPLVLVTGGAGFIGSHTLVELIENGYDVFVVDNLCNSNQKSLDAVKRLTGYDVPFVRCDIENFQDMDRVFGQNQFDAVVHFGNLKSGRESVEFPDKYYASNIGSMFVLLRLAEKYGVNRFVFSSSATVYGSPDVMPVSEDYPVGRVLSPYGLTKYLGELYLKDFACKHPGFKAIALRYFNPVGSHPSGLLGEDPKDKIPVSLIPYITKVLLGDLPYLNVFGNDYDTRDGTGLRDYVHVMDVASGHVSALRYLDTMSDPYDVFNLGTGKGTTVLEIVSAFEKVSGKKIPIKYVARRAGDVSRSYADISKAKRLLGWEPKRTVMDCAGDAWRWQLTHPNGFDTNE